MKYWFLCLVCLPLLGDTVEFRMNFKGESALSLRTIQHAFASVGYRLEPEDFKAEQSQGELSGKAIGNKGFHAAGVMDTLKKSRIRIEKWDFAAKTLTATLDTREGIWNLDVISQEDGAELKRLNAAQWFRLEGGGVIRIQPPYVGKWYPDVAVFDAGLELLSSIRSSEPKEELEFELPPDACYLKISNVQGMRVLKEGMWIESIPPKQ